MALEIDFHGKNVVVVGGTSGINQGIALGFAELGANIGVASRKQEKVDATLALIEAAGVTGFGACADVRDFDTVSRFFERAQAALGDIDVLVSGAAGNFPAMVNGMSANDRLSFLHNWRATGFAKFDHDAEPDQFLVTVVNNRGDRVPRSQVFARVLAEDAAAHRHVVIGLLGPNLDRGDGPDRWSHWRPTVSICQHEDLLIDRLELLCEAKLRPLAEQVVADIRSIAPETTVRTHEVSGNQGRLFQDQSELAWRFRTIQCDRSQPRDYLIAVVEPSGAVDRESVALRRGTEDVRPGASS